MRDNQVCNYVAREETVLIRKAELADLERLLEIYNYEVEHGWATMDLVPKTLEQRRLWFDSYNIEGDNHPLIVAVADDGCVVGYASLSKFRQKDGYKSTVELSIYVHQDYRRQGFATKLMAELLDIARADEQTHVVTSIIAESNAGSKALHKKFGFTLCGTIRQAAHKFDQYHDISQYQIIVG